MSQPAPGVVPPEVWGNMVREAVPVSCGSTAPYVSKIHAAQLRNIQIFVKLTSRMQYPKAYTSLERRKPSVQPLEREIHPFT